MKPKLIFVHGTLATGGAEVLRVSTLEEFAVRRKYDIRVCVQRSRGNLADSIEAMGFDVDFLNNRGGLFDVPGIYRLAKYFKKHQPDIVQSSQFLTNLQTVLAARLANVRRVIIEEHGIYTWKKRRHLILDRWFNSTASGVTACSHAVAESAAKQLKIPQSRITVIHNCASALHFEPPAVDLIEFRRSLVGNDTPFMVSIVGTLRWEKGHTFLLDVWRQLIDEGTLPKDSVLAVIGDGPLRSKLQDAATNYPSIRFLGTRHDTREILHASDLFVLPSINEGFGIAIVEAMCAGLPVISTTSGGIPEVIHHNKTGILVAPEDTAELADAIARLYKSPTERTSLGKAAREEAKRRFTPSAYVDQLEQLYESILNTKS